MELKYETLDMILAEKAPISSVEVKGLAQKLADHIQEFQNILGKLAIEESSQKELARMWLEMNKIVERMPDPKDFE